MVLQTKFSTTHCAHKATGYVSTRRVGAFIVLLLWAKVLDFAENVSQITCRMKKLLTNVQKFHIAFSIVHLVTILVFHVLKEHTMIQIWLELNTAFLICISQDVNLAKKVLTQITTYLLH